MTGYTFTIQYGLCMNMLSVSSIQNCDFFFDFFFFTVKVVVLYTVSMSAGVFAFYLLLNLSYMSILGYF